MITMLLVLLIVVIGIVLLSISPALLVVASFVALDILVFKMMFGRKKKRKEKNQGEA